MSKVIPLSEPSLNGREWDNIKECLDTGWVSTAGKFVDRFEEGIAQYTHSKFAIATSSGTAALHVSLLLAGVMPDDEVIVPTLTFIAPINTVRYVQAHPVFMDCDSYFNLDVEKVRNFILKETEFKGGVSRNKTSQRVIRAIIPVHMFGHAVDLESLTGLLEERNIKIIEDATESLGASYTQGKLKGRATGTVGQLGCFSFNGNKIITTGGGGMIVTDDEQLALKAKYLTTQAKDDGIRNIHHEVGYNFRLNNIQAAMGVAQLESLPEIIAKKKNNYMLYKSKLQDVAGINLVNTPDYAESNYWMYAINICKETFGQSCENVMNVLLSHDVGVRPLFYLNHLQKPYADCQSYNVELAKQLLEITLCVPSSADLKEEDIDFIIGLIKGMSQRVSSGLVN